MRLRSTGTVYFGALSFILHFFLFLFFFRFYKHELRHMAYLSEELDTGNVCPACPEVDVIFICIEIVPCSL